jgi:hypothetical protein
MGRHLGWMVLALVPLASCDGDGGSTPTPSPAPTSTPTPTPSPTATPTPTPSPTSTPTGVTTVYDGHKFGPPNFTLNTGSRGLTYQGNLDLLVLGPVLVGPVSTPFPSIYDDPGDLTVTVHCPPGVNPCNAQLPQGSVYTYVLRVDPGYGGKGDISRFRPNFPVKGIVGIGLSAKQAIAAAPHPNAGPFAVCEASGYIFWEVASLAVTGFPSWYSNEVITFYYQSTSPPSATLRPYTFQAPDATGRANAPGPDDGAPGACDGLP